MRLGAAVACYCEQGFWHLSHLAGHRTRSRQVYTLPLNLCAVHIAFGQWKSSVTAMAGRKSSAWWQWPTTSGLRPLVIFQLCEGPPWPCWRTAEPRRFVRALHAGCLRAPGRLQPLQPRCARPAFSGRLGWRLQWGNSRPHMWSQMRSQACSGDLERHPVAPHGFVGAAWLHRDERPFYWCAEQRAAGKAVCEPLAYGHGSKLPMRGALHTLPYPAT